MARGLLNDPWILFLDEPTLGLDVAAARGIRELVLDWKAAVPGRTVLLTTHYMAEADELCERIAIVDHGRILAIGTPDELKRRVQRESIFRLELDHLDGGAAALAPAAGRRLGGAGGRQRTPRPPARRRQPRARARTARWAAWSPRLGGLGSPDPRAAQVGADARGRVRGAGRARASPTTDAPDGPARRRRATPATDRGAGRARGERARRMTDPAGIFAHSRGGTDPRTPSDWTRRQVAENNLRALGRPRLPARPRA